MNGSSIGDVATGRRGVRTDEASRTAQLGRDLSGPVSTAWNR